MPALEDTGLLDCAREVYGKLRNGYYGLANNQTLCADLHRFAFLLGASNGEELFGEPTP